MKPAQPFDAILGCVHAPVEAAGVRHNLLDAPRAPPDPPAFTQGPKRMRRNDLPFLVNRWGLTSMQQACLRQLGLGLRHKEAAAALCIAEKTLSTHISRAVERMGVLTIHRAVTLWDRHVGGHDND